MGEDASSRIEIALEQAVDLAVASPTPPRFARAFRHAVFPGGQRLRPRLALEVAAACGDRAPALADSVGVAIEFIHCGSLVHDDLPCFDDASIRRGRPTVHEAFGEALAVLVGDGLIVAAFEALGRVGAQHPAELAKLVAIVARAAGQPAGIVSGQAWESEPAPDLRVYHQLKTAALFEAAVQGGALAGGGDPHAWRGLGGAIGEAYQIADDLHDVLARPTELGKPVGQDAALGRPSAVEDYGIAGAFDALDRARARALTRIPECPGREGLEAWVDGLIARVTPNAASVAREQVALGVR